MKFFLKWLISAGAFLLTAYIVPGIAIASFFTALILVIVWGFINMFIKPVIHIIALPITLLTLGLFSLVINGALFYFMASFIKGFYIDGFISALLGAFLVYFFTWIGEKILIKEEEN